MIVCNACEKIFKWTVKDQEFFAKMVFDRPKRCKTCRWDRIRHEQENQSDHNQDNTLAVIVEEGIDVLEKFRTWLSQREIG